MQEPGPFVVGQGAAGLTRPSPLVVAEGAILTVDERLPIDLMRVLYLFVVTRLSILLFKKGVGHITGDAFVEPKVRPIRTSHRDTPPLMRKFMRQKPRVVGVVGQI